MVEGFGFRMKQMLKGIYREGPPYYMKYTQEVFNLSYLLMLIYPTTDSLSL